MLLNHNRNIFPPPHRDFLIDTRQQRQRYTEPALIHLINHPHETGAIRASQKFGDMTTSPHLEEQLLSKAKKTLRTSTNNAQNGKNVQKIEFSIP
ncbi:hypothetical protein HMPREF9999_01388 [Alloprevotella sp. oral taxon 473 str. F0040]|nr:hypothetical protein HMPREF9999_01388 [Alloprevotella sp. oral taxon 473 str. F0040]